MKYLTLILLICVSSFSLNKIVIPQRASSGAVITASKTNENLDTIASKVNKLIDSLDQKFPRFTDYSSGDSTLRSKRADFDTTVSDTMYNSGGLYSERVSTPSAGITRANIDTSHSRHATADSATITVFKGMKTFRDSSYFAGGLRGSRLYMQTASVDSFTKSFVVRGNVFGFSQTAGSCPFTSYGTTNKINGYFGTLSNNDGGVICYDSSGTARVNLPTRGSGYILGSIAINQTTPDSNLTVGGSAHVTGNARIDGTATSTMFSGPLTGNVTGNVSGSSGSCTGNAATATTATTATNVSGGSVSATTGTFSGAISATTINTGNGAVECYAQNQNLTTTSNVTFNQISNATGIINAITEASGTFPCTLRTADVSVIAVGTARWAKVGRLVSIMLPAITGTSVSTELNMYFGEALTSNSIWPSTYYFNALVMCVDNGGETLCQIKFDSGLSQSMVRVEKVDGSGFTASNPKGFIDAAIQYMTN